MPVRKRDSDVYGFGGITVAYNTRTREDVDAVLAQAEAAGAKRLKPAQEAFRGGIQGTMLILMVLFGR